MTFETLITILTIENLNSWQSLLPDNWEWHWTAFAILAMFNVVMLGSFIWTFWTACTQQSYDPVFHQLLFKLFSILSSIFCTDPPPPPQKNQGQQRKCQKWRARRRCSGCSVNDAIHGFWLSISRCERAAPYFCQKENGKVTNHKAEGAKLTCKA